MSETPVRPAGADPAARAAIIAAAAAARAAPDWDLVLKRNNVERLKREKFPLEIVNELEELGQRNYLDISEEDMVRFQWFGLYQDKPKVGYFMLRVKAPSGIMTAAQYRVLGDLSLKHKITISTCAEQCNAPEINCIVFIGARQGGRNGFSLRVGGGLSSAPRLARDLNVFVPQEDALPVSKAILDVWRTDLRYRLSRAKARLKFLVDDYGVEGVREAVEKQLGRPLETLKDVPRPIGSADHLGPHRQKQAGVHY